MIYAWAGREDDLIKMHAIVFGTFTPYPYNAGTEYVGFSSARLRFIRVIQSDVIHVQKLTRQRNDVMTMDDVS